MGRHLVLLLLLLCSTGNAKPLRFAGIEGGPNFIYDSSTPRPRGLVPKFADQYVASPLKEKFSLDIDWHQAPTSRLLRELETGELDVLCFLIKTPEREKIYHYGKEPFISGQPAMIVRKDFVKGTEVTTYKDFQRKNIALMSGVTIPKFISENDMQIIPLTGFNISSRTLSMLDAGRIDGIFIHLHQVAEFIVADNKFQDKLKVVKLPGDPVKLYLAFRKGLQPEVRDLVDQTFLKHREAYAEMMSSQK